MAANKTENQTNDTRMKWCHDGGFFDIRTAEIAHKRGPVAKLTLHGAHLYGRPGYIGVKESWPLW